MLVVLFTTLLLAYPQWPAFAGIAFPALAALLIGEVFFALDGITRQEYTSGIDGEKDSAVRIANYNPLRAVMRRRSRIAFYPMKPICPHGQPLDRHSG